MMTYLKIKNSNQVNKGDILVEFYYNSNEVWNYFQVYKIEKTGISLECKSGALLFISNDRLNNKDEYFKILNS